MQDQRLKIAIQKSGRLSEPSIGLLQKCDIAFDNGAGKLRSTAYDFPLEILFLRDDDIPQYIEDGVADAGIIGQNILAESDCELESVEMLGFGRCRLSLAVPRGFEYGSVSDIAGKRIATSYPRILTSYLERKGIAAEIHAISGSVEIAPGIGVADAICDLVSSGSTLLTNGLREVETIMGSEAVLVARKELGDRARELLAKLLFRIRSVNAARDNKYILLNVPNEKIDEIRNLLPGMKSPTVMPLAITGWSSVHSVISEHDFWNVVEQLKAAGAQGILVVSIDQMIL
jgi:ATP phosphoribosyltransferase